MYVLQSNGYISEVLSKDSLILFEEILTAFD